MATLATGVAIVPCQAQSSVTLTVAELRALPAFTGHYGFLKNGAPYPYSEADYTGIALETLLEQKLNLEAAASQVVIRSTDDYSVTLTLQQIRAVYPGNLKVILAYAKYGAPLLDDEGPVRLIVPQSTPGTHDRGGEINMPSCAKWVRTLEVTPVKAGTAVPSPSSVPGSSIVVYGSVTEPGTAGPVTPPAPTPAAQPAQQQAASPQGDSPEAGAATAGTLTNGSRRLGLYLCAAILSKFLPSCSRVPLVDALMVLAPGL
jgi:DMSO/TMAO reductase YedYZ molybdopterin-dependent catalytic subunit